MRKLTIASITLVLLVFVYSCSQDDDAAPFGDFSSLTWWSSPATEFAETEKTIAVDNYIAFKDLSKGVIDHQWTISSGSSLLSNTFTETDTVYSKLIVGGTSTSNSLAYVLFTQPGTSEVRLVNSFKDSVAESVNENGIWKVNKVFTITVTE